MILLSKESMSEYKLPVKLYQFVCPYCNKTRWMEGGILPKCRNRNNHIDRKPDMIWSERMIEVSSSTIAKSINKKEVKKMVDKEPTLKYVDELPASKKAHGKYDELIAKFAKSERTVAEIENATAGTLSSLKTTIERLKLADKMYSVMRAKKIYLAKGKKD